MDTLKIAVVGVGGCGKNMAQQVKGRMENLETIAINTDRMSLKSSRVDKKVLIEASREMESVREAAKISRDLLKDVLKDKNLVFVIAGMGGATGTAASPVVAEVAKELGAVVIAVVTVPFKVETRERRRRAFEGLEELRRVADTVIVLENEILLKYFGDLPLSDGFVMMNELVAEALMGISELIKQSCLDLADLKAMMTGVGMLLVAEKTAAGLDYYPWLGANYRKAKCALVHLTAGPENTVEELSDFMEELTSELENANVVWSVRVEEGQKGIAAIVVVIGVDWNGSNE